jgi:hypothetical protein
MIQHVWSVVCQSASFDAQTNSVSLFNTLENLLVFGTPSKEKPFILSCEIVSLWAREKQEVPCSGQMQVSLNIPGTDAPHTISLEIDLTKTPFHRTRITIEAIPMIVTGRFEFLVEYRLAGKENWDTAAKLPFIVSSQNLEGATPKPSA